MDRFDALQAFTRVVETGSFTKAAHTLQLSKTTVTHLVQQLEARLKVRLLHRTTRQVRVTADGAACYERALRLLADLEALDSSLAGASGMASGRLRVDVPSPLARLLLMPALPDFHGRHPGIRLDMGVSDRRVDLIGDNVDCVVRGGALPDSTLQARQVGDLPIGLYAAPRYLAQAGRPQHPDDLAGTHHRIVGYLRADGRTTPYELTRGDEQVRVTGRHAVATDDGNAYLAAGVAGMGVMWLPRYMADAHVAAGELEPVLEDWHAPSMPLYAAYPPTRHPSARLRAFIDWVAEVLARHAPVTRP